MVAKRYRIVRTIRLFAGRISTIVYISIFPAFIRVVKSDICQNPGKIPDKDFLFSLGVSGLVVYV